MIPQQLESQSQKLEVRVEILESELAEIKQVISESLKEEKRWWLKIAGSFENDPTFDEATHLGQEWRKSAE
jgi:hypothetical protein